MNRQADDNTRLTDYLLGRLSPEEAASIEQRYLANPAFHDALLAAERDLIDQYVHGEFSERDAFETHFLSSPSRRERVAFARALSQTLARGSQAGASVSGAGAQSAPWRRLFATRQRTWLGAAAALVLVVAGWLVVANRPGQPQNTAASSPTQPAPGRVADPPPPEAALPPPDKPGVEVRVATLLLTPSVTRSRDETPTLRIGGATDVRLELYAESSGFDRYRATIRTGDGKEIWRQDQLKPVATAAGPAVIIALPANRLGADDYTVRLSGIRGSDVEEIAGYSFRVTK